MKDLKTLTSKEKIKLIVTGDGCNHEKTIYKVFEGLPRNVVLSIFTTFGYPYQKRKSWKTNLKRLERINGSGKDYLTIVMVPFGTETELIL